MSDKYDADPLGYIDAHLRRGRIHSGQDHSAESLRTDFLRQDANIRTELLGQIDDRLRDANLTLLEAQKLYGIRKQLNNAHELARKVKR
jgi:hypothetical protein